MTLEELVNVTASGGLAELLQTRGDEVTPELASEARSLFKQAVQAGNLGLAQVAAIAGAHAWLHLGDRHQGLVNHVDSLQIEYMRAETPEAYAEVREALLQARVMGDEIGDREQAFKAAIIAADCSFWAAQASHPTAKSGLLLQTMEDIVAASGEADAGDAAEYERYVSLLAATASEAMSTVWLDDEARAQALLRQLAQAADRTIPTNYSYAQTGDAEKTAQTARVLASLSDDYGA